MTFDSGANSRWTSDNAPGDDSDRSGRLSQSGQMLGWAGFGALVLIGFFFGIVTGYEAPKPALTPKPTKELAKAEPPKPVPKIAPEPQPNPHVPPITPMDDPPKIDPPTVDPPKVDPPKIDNPPPKKEPPKTEVLVPVSFQKDVLPIFRSYCITCHGGGTGKPKGDVDLRTIASVMKGGGGPIIELGKPDKSAIYTTIADSTMPPEGKRPGKGETDVIRNWILGGAKPRRPIRKPQKISRIDPR